MRGLFDSLERRFEHIEPEKRRRFAIHLLVWSFLLGHVNVGMFLGGIISHELMDLVTNYLSWCAITITALDVVMTTDVRKEQDE